MEGTPTTIENRQAEIEALHREVFRKPPPKDTGPHTDPHLELSDRELIDRGHQARNGAKFARLWQGNATGYPSPSEATAALLEMLVFWCGDDPARVGRLFRQSGLMRKKWNRDQSGSTWGAIEIQKAIGRATEFYTPGQRLPDPSYIGLEAVMRATQRLPEKEAGAKGGARRKASGQAQGDPQSQQEGEPARIPWVGHWYCVKGGRLCKADYDGKKWEYKPLANFTALIEEEITRDDSLRAVKEFMVKGGLDNGRSLPPARITAKEFDGLAWIRREWGSAASQAPGPSSWAPPCQWDHGP